MKRHRKCIEPFRIGDTLLTNDPHRCLRPYQLLRPGVIHGPCLVHCLPFGRFWPSAYHAHWDLIPAGSLVCAKFHMEGASFVTLDTAPTATVSSLIPSPFIFSIFNSLTPLVVRPPSEPSCAILHLFEWCLAYEQWMWGVAAIADAS